MPDSTAELQHFVYFPFSPSEVYSLLMDETAHAAFTGAPARIDPRVGGAFSVFDGKITGSTTALEPGVLIVQEWRGDDWPEGQTSIVRFGLEAVHDGRGCALTFRHKGFPPERRDELCEGWQAYYWEPMADHLRNSKIAVVRRFLEGFKNQANLDVVDETWTEDCKLHVQGFDTPPGRKAQKEVGKIIFDAFTQVHVDVIDTIVEGDRVVERHRATARHTGDFMGIRATNKDVYWTENHIYRMQDGRIAEAWSEVSFHDLIAQISGSRTSAG